MEIIDIHTEFLVLHFHSPSQWASFLSSMTSTVSNVGRDGDARSMYVWEVAPSLVHDRWARHLDRF